MGSGSVSLDLAVKLIHVEGHRNKDALCQYILCSTVWELSEFHVLFYLCKGSFHLNTSVHSELNATITCDPFQTFFPESLFCFRYMGDNKFEPKIPLTRALMCQIIYAGAQQTIEPTPSPSVSPKSSENSILFVLDDNENIQMGEIVNTTTR